jgi:hypothetical protein
MGYDDLTPEQIWAIEEFEGELTEDVEIVMLAMSKEFGYTLIQQTIIKDGSWEGRMPRWRSMRSDPELKKQAEKIIVREIARMAMGQQVNGLMRWCILHWCYFRDVGKKAGNPGLDFIEHMHRIREVERIVGDGGSQKKIDRSIDERLGIRGKTGRTARAWKRRIGNKSK